MAYASGHWSTWILLPVKDVYVPRGDYLVVIGVVGFCIEERR